MPATSATPSTMAIAVSAARSRRVARPRERDGPHALSDLGQVLHRVDDLGLAGARMSLTICPSERNRIRSAIAAARGSWVTITTVWPTESTERRSSCEDLVAGGGVQVAGRLVGEQDGRPAEQGPRDRDPLLLAARQLGRAVGEAVAQAGLVDHRLQPLRVGLAAGDRQRQQHVLARGQHRQQVEELEDEADVVAAQPGQLVVVELGDLDALDRDRCPRSACRARPGCASASTCPTPTGPSPRSACRARSRPRRRAARSPPCRPRRKRRVTPDGRPRPAPASARRAMRRSCHGAPTVSRRSARRTRACTIDCVGCVRCCMLRGINLGQPPRADGRSARAVRPRPATRTSQHLRAERQRRARRSSASPPSSSARREADLRAVRLRGAGDRAHARAAGRGRQAQPARRRGRRTPSATR